MSDAVFHHMKQARVLLQLYKGEADVKVALVANGAGRSNDDAEAACWREVKRQVRTGWPDATWRVRAMWFENVGGER